MIDQPTVLILSWQDARYLAAPLRRAVFVEEQGVPEELEWDDRDDIATHAIVLDADSCVGTGRLIPPEKGCAAMGRMAVKREWRGRGIGSLLMRSLLKQARAIGAREVVLHAQIAATGFYRNFGFTAVGPEFQEAGIAHVEMRLALDPTLKR